MVRLKHRIVTIFFLFVLVMAWVLPAFAAEEHPPRLVDDANLLSSSEAKELTEKLDEISERQQFDVVVVTVKSLDGSTPMEYADDFFDYNGYGIGPEYDGVLLLISMAERDVWISTTGFGITAFTDAGINWTVEQLQPYLKDGRYYQAFGMFAIFSDRFVTQARDGDPFDVGNMSDMPKPPLSMFATLIAIGIGIIIAFLVMMAMRMQLRTVRRQAAAGNYLRKGSFNVTERRDAFLYRNVNKTKRESSSGGGSSTHTSSSGRSHGGGGGKF